MPLCDALNKTPWYDSMDASKGPIQDACVTIDQFYNMIPLQDANAVPGAEAPAALLRVIKTILA